MPTRQEYEQLFVDEAEEWQVGDFYSRNDVDRAAAEVRRGFHRIFVEQTKVISARWKEGFKALKLENDTWQKDLRDSHRDAEINLRDEQQHQYKFLLKR